MNQRAAEPQRSTSSTPTAQSGFLQRKCACGEQTIAGGESQERKQKKSLLQRRTSGSSEPSSIPAIVHEILGLPGQPLDSSSRAFMEPRFGCDFSQVRVHTDGRAAESAHAVNALAYTVGRNVVFGAGQYAPQSPRGKHLLAHELTHVVQQASGTISVDAESRANSSADSVLLAKPVNQNKLGGAAVSLQKQEKTGETGLSSVHEDDPFLRALLRAFPQSNAFKKKPRNLFEPSWLQMPPQKTKSQDIFKPLLQQRPPPKPQPNLNVLGQRPPEQIDFTSPQWRFLKKGQPLSRAYTPNTLMESTGYVGMSPNFLRPPVPWVNRMDAFYKPILETEGEMGRFKGSSETPLDLDWKVGNWQYQKGINFGTERFGLGADLNATGLASVAATANFGDKTNKFSLYGSLDLQQPDQKFGGGFTAKLDIDETIRKLKQLVKKKHVDK